MCRSVMSLSGNTSDKADIWSLQNYGQLGIADSNGSGWMLSAALQTLIDQIQLEHDCRSAHFIAYDQQIFAIRRLIGGD